AYQAYLNSGGSLDGIGFVLTEDDCYAGIDLDKCIDAVDGKQILSETAKAITSQLPTYREISPSGKGVRLFVKGEIPEGKSDSEKGIEVYSCGRYLTITGHTDLAFPQIELCQSELDGFFNQYFPKIEQANDFDYSVNHSPSSQFDVRDYIPQLTPN